MQGVGGRQGHAGCRGEAGACRVQGGGRGHAGCRGESGGTQGVGGGQGACRGHGGGRGMQGVGGRQGWFDPLPPICAYTHAGCTHGG